MATNTKKKTTAKATTPEAQPPAPQEAHLDPAQFVDMDDASLQQLAQDLGLDPAAYADRDALISAISAVPVIPGPPEAQGDTPEPFTPYEATVAVPLVVIRRGKVPHPEDKPIGTIASGARVTVTAIVDGYAMLANGTYVKADFLTKQTT